MSIAVREPDLHVQESVDPSLFWTRGRALAASLVSLATGLMAIGAVMTFSARSRVPSDEAIAMWPVISQWSRQLLFVIGGLVAMLVSTRLSYRLWSAKRGVLAIGLLALAIVLLLLVFVPGVGVEVKGARRWIHIGSAASGLRLQSSEVAKLAMPIFLAVWMTKLVNIREWRGFLSAVGVSGLVIGLVGLEDYGTAALMAAVAGIMLMMAGARWLHLILPVIPAAAAFAYLLISKPHRMERLTTFQNIWADPDRTGYQAIQSLCTIAGGGWWGRGLGQGIVKQYLPEAHNDFIFAVICEELGAVGAMAVIALFIAFLWNAHRIVCFCKNPTGRLLAMGLAMTIGLQAAMNIAVVTVSVPTKGISLPLVSAGGSGTICLGAMVGILAGTLRADERARQREAIDVE